MTEALFSGYTIVDTHDPGPPSGTARRRRVPGPVRPSKLASEDPEMTGPTSPGTGSYVILQLQGDVAGPRREAVMTFLENLVRVTGTLEASRQEAAIARLAEVILPDDLAAARGALASDNLALRDRFVRQTAPLTSAEVAAQAGHGSKNRYATAARWKKAGDIISVNHRGVELYPAFQFRDGRPHPAIKTILAALPVSMSPWQRALWFVSTNGWLDGKAPADLLDDKDAVIAAARHEAEEVVG